MKTLRSGKAACLLLFALCCLLLAANAFAGVLVMKNGDRITGTVSGISGSQITIDPDYGDAFQVDLAAVDYAEAAGDLEGELADGREGDLDLLGKGDDGQQLVRLDDEVLAVPLTDVIEMAPPTPYYERESNVDLSLVFTRGNTDTDNNQLRGDTRLRFGIHRHFLDAQFVRERTDGSSTKKQDLIGYDYNWLFRPPWFLSANASYERDPIKDLDYRWILGLNIGRDIWDSDRRFLSVQAGPGVQFEDRANNEEEQAVLQYRLRFRHNFLESALSAFHNQRLTHNLSGEDNTVIKTSTGLRWNFTDNLYARTSLDYDYETDPSDDAEKDDSTVRFGVGATF